MSGISYGIALLAFACLPLNALAQGAAEKLAWMAGEWTQKGEKETVSENWQGPAGGMLVATNRTRRASRGRSTARSAANSGDSRQADESPVVSVVSVST